MCAEEGPRRKRPSESLEERSHPKPALILDFQPPELGENTHLLFNPKMKWNLLYIGFYMCLFLGCLGFHSFQYTQFFFPSITTPGIYFSAVTNTPCDVRQWYQQETGMLNVCHSSKCIIYKINSSSRQGNQWVGTFIIIIFACGKEDYYSPNILVSLPAVLLLPVANLNIPSLLE